MAHLPLIPNLTHGHSDGFEHQLRTTHSGQAYFANTGPFGATCGGCKFHGYHRQKRNASGDTIGTTFRRDACAQFFKLTGNHGPAVPTSAAACKYFERK
jgi:hypothetical protein